MRKRICLGVLTVLVFSLILGGCTQEKNEELKQNEEAMLKQGERVLISLEEMEEKMKNKDSFVVVFTQEGCPYCEEFYQLFDEYKKEHPLRIYDVDLTAEKASPEENLVIIHQYFPAFSKTPGIYYVKKGKLENSLSDSITELTMETFNNWVEQCGILK